jgi:hypothetical protein
MNDAMPVAASRPVVPGGELLQLRPWVLNRARRDFAQAERDVQAKLDAVAADWTDASLADVQAHGTDDVAAYQRWRANIMDDVRRRNGGDAS